MKGNILRFFKICIFISVVFVGSGCVAKKSTPQSNSVLQPTSPSPVVPQRNGVVYSSLAELTDTFCDDLYADIGEKKIYLDRENILDASENDVSNFSGYLEQEVDSSCSLKGLTWVYDLDNADFLIGALYRRYKYDLRVFLKYHPVDMSSKKTLDYRIAKKMLPPDSFSSMKYKAKKLARAIATGQEGKKLYIKPVVEGNDLYVSDFSKAFTARVKNEIVREYKDVVVIDWKATRSIKKVRKTDSLAGSDVANTGASTVLSGKYFIEGDVVAVHMTIENQADGRLINSAAVDIAKEDISSRLEDEDAEVLATFADFKAEANQEMVKLSTNRGSEYPIYRNGEKIVFTMQVREPLYVYLYNFNPAGELSLLYPFEENVRPSKLLPNRMYTIPSAADNFELVVEPPYGKEGLKLFASKRPIPFPRIALKQINVGKRSIGVIRKQQQTNVASSGRVLRPNDLVDYYRGKGQRLGVEIYEDSFILETRR